LGAVGEHAAVAGVQQPHRHGGLLRRAGCPERLVEELRHRHDRGAEVEGEAVDHLALPAAAGAGVALDDGDVVTVPDQVAGGGEAGEARTDDDDAAHACLHASFWAIWVSPSTAGLGTWSPSSWAQAASTSSEMSCSTSSRIPHSAISVRSSASSSEAS